MVKLKKSQKNTLFSIFPDFLDTFWSVRPILRFYCQPQSLFAFCRLLPNKGEHLIVYFL